jgi:hypothetical protein
MKFNRLTPILLIPIYFLMAHEVKGQTGQIRGVVRDGTTRIGLPYANVFINQTSIGTATDPSGNFQLNGVPTGLNELVISYIGYKQNLVRVQVKPGDSLTLEISMVEDKSQLAAVEVQGTRDKEWEKQLKQFEKIFLGTNAFARTCKIVNPWVLNFTEETADGKTIFMATADKPIEIENQALGYTVIYYLKELVASTDYFRILGEIHFRELITTDKKLASTWEANRLFAYKGSYRHLFKSLLEGRSFEEGFNLYFPTVGTNIRDDQNPTFSSRLNQTLKLFPTKNIVTPLADRGLFRINLLPEIEVHYTQTTSSTRVYRDISFPVSWLDIKRGYIDVNREGIVSNAGDLVVAGAMFEARLADQLPFNYKPGDALKLLEVPPIARQKMFQLQEKAYLHTDKPYYYPGDVIWFKAYMNYGSPERMDTLSRVLYAEFINPSKNIIQTQIVPINYGVADGYFKLPDTLATGNYSIRAYTNWMLNYSPLEIFHRSIPVLSDYEKPSLNSSGYSKNADSSRLIVRTVKPVYHPREKITVELTFDSLNADFQGAQLSVSVTDVNQVIDLHDGHTILNEFNFRDNNNSTNPGITNKIEYGISIQGQHMDRKGKPERASLLIAEEALLDISLIDTDPSGKFWVTGFQLADPVTLGFQYADAKTKHPGKILLTERFIPAIEPASSSSFEIIRKNKLVRKKSVPESSDKAILLEEVVTTATPIEPKAPPVQSRATYGKPEFILIGESLLSSNVSSLVDALRTRVPGLYVVMEEGSYRLRFGGPSTFQSTAVTEPMLIVDGIQLSGQGTLSVYDQLMQIQTLQVERVEIIRNGGAAVYGSRGANGIIAVYTKNETSYIQASSSPGFQKNFFQKATVAGFIKPVRIRFPDYSEPNAVSDIVADYRSTLFWKPDLVIDSSGKASFYFYAADLPTHYQIVIEGITINQEPVRSTHRIEIREK